MFFGNWDGSDTFPFVNYVVFIFEGFLLALVLSNVLIAIISNTFSTFNDQKDLKDIQALFDIFVELTAVVRLFSQVTLIKGEEKYIHVISSEKEDKNMIEDIQERLYSKIHLELTARYRVEYD